MLPFAALLGGLLGQGGQGGPSAWRRSVMYCSLFKKSRVSVSQIVNKLAKPRSYASLKLCPLIT